MHFTHIQQQDPDVYEILQKELKRQQDGLMMIPSENYASVATLEAAGTVLTNKYAEGYPRKRYYTGNEYIDQIEQLAIDRAKELFGAEHVNVQPHSGSTANMECYAAVLEPGDTILGMRLDQNILTKALRGLNVPQQVAPQRLFDDQGLGIHLLDRCFDRYRDNGCFILA